MWYAANVTRNELETVLQLLTLCNIEHIQIRDDRGGTGTYLVSIYLPVGSKLPPCHHLLEWRIATFLDYWVPEEDGNTNFFATDELPYDALRNCATVTSLMKIAERSDSLPKQLRSMREAIHDPR